MEPGTNVLDLHSSARAHVYSKHRRSLHSRAHPSSQERLVTFATPVVRPRRPKELSPSESSDDEYESEEDEDVDLSTCSESSWSTVNDRKVSEITLHVLYQPRSLTLMVVIILSLSCVAFLRKDEDTMANVSDATVGLSSLFLGIGLLIFPNGPFIRPHPVVWRLVFGLSLLYLLFLVFVLFQHSSDARQLLQWVDPQLRNVREDSLAYTFECQLTWKNLWKRIDLLYFGRFLVWVFRAMLIRHYSILWSINIICECTDLFLSHFLLGFTECWWGALILDALICNGTGIHIGMYLCKQFQVHHFQWEGIKEIRGTRGKLKRVILQFTPERWSRTRWLDSAGTFVGSLLILFLVLMVQVSEMNTFLLRYVFALPPTHYLVMLRVLLLCVTAAPSLRQYYVFITERPGKRLGTQAWVFVIVIVTELFVGLKFCGELLQSSSLLPLAAWLAVITVFCIGSVSAATAYGPLFKWIPLHRSRRKKRKRRRLYSASREHDASD